jgi:proteasome lid subunit RPN8/RPN11
VYPELTGQVSFFCLREHHLKETDRHMTVQLPEALLARIHQTLEGTYPNEGGGFLLGQAADAGIRIEDVTPIQNVFEEEEQYHRYAMTPADWARMEDAADERGLTLMGYYHSHPDSPAIPSEYDRTHALPNFVYIIVSVVEGRTDHTRVWRLTDDRSRFDEQTLEMT